VACCLASVRNNTGKLDVAHAGCCNRLLSARARPTICGSGI
jgi:hypothetical protein